MSDGVVDTPDGETVTSKLIGDGRGEVEGEGRAKAGQTDEEVRGG